MFRHDESGPDRMEGTDDCERESKRAAGRRWRLATWYSTTAAIAAYQAGEKNV